MLSKGFYRKVHVLIKYDKCANYRDFEWNKLISLLNEIQYNYIKYIKNYINNKINLKLYIYILYLTVVFLVVGKRVFSVWLKTQDHLLLQRIHPTTTYKKYNIMSWSWGYKSWKSAGWTVKITWLENTIFFHKMKHIPKSSGYKWIILPPLQNYQTVF